MFHQGLKEHTKILVAEEQRYQKPFEDHEMCVHLFGGISSPNCCNYALKRTLEDIWA